jgi:hypothetical protein
MMNNLGESSSIADGKVVLRRLKKSSDNIIEGIGLWI